MGKYWSPCDVDKNCPGIGPHHKANHTPDHLPDVKTGEPVKIPESPVDAEQSIPSGATAEDMQLFEDFKRVMAMDSQPTPTVRNYAKDRSKSGKKRRK